MEPQKQNGMRRTNRTTLKQPKNDADDKVMIGIRCPADLRARLEAAAKAEDRNLSQECVRRLRLSFETGG